MCLYEYVVFTKQIGNERLIINVYVDDLLVTCTNISPIDEFKTQMSIIFEISDLGNIKYYLSIEVDHSHGCIELKQTRYAKKLLERAGMTHYKWMNKENEFTTLNTRA